MSLKEKLINHAPEALKKRFPINKTSFEEFINLSKTGKKEIEVDSGIRGEVFGRMPEGHLGWLTFTTAYSAETPEGRPIKFVEFHKGRLGNTRDDPQEEEIIQNFVTAESRVSTLKRIMPKEFKIKGPSAKMDEEIRKKMWSDAEKNHVKPFSKAKTLFAKKQ